MQNFHYCPILTKIGTYKYQQIYKTPQYQISQKSFQRFSRCCLRIDIETDMAKLVHAFVRIFITNASKTCTREHTRFFTSYCL
jgi:hypothetical protein